MAAAFKVGTSPDEDVGGHPGSSQGLIGEATPPPLSRCIIRDDHQEIEVAVGAIVSPRAGTEQVDALRVVRTFFLSLSRASCATSCAGHTSTRYLVLPLLKPRVDSNDH